MVLNGQLPPHPSGCRWSGVRIGRGWGWWQGLAGVHRAQPALGLAWWWLPDGYKVRVGLSLVWKVDSKLTLSLSPTMGTIQTCSQPRC